MTLRTELTPVNFTPGRVAFDNIVLHTEDGSDQSALNRFRDPASLVSAHKLIGENGEVVTVVQDGNTAWGAGNWYVNQRSLNLEHEDLGNYNDAVRTDEEYDASARTVADWCRRYNIPCVKVTEFTSVTQNGFVYSKVPAQRGIVVHKDVAIRGTACPDGLDWERIIRQAQEILAGASTSPVQTAVHNVEFTALPTEEVRVTLQTLLVRSAPSLSAQSGVGNTPDGNLHAGDPVTVIGYALGDDVDYSAIGGKHTNLWLKTINDQGLSHWIWAGGTDFNLMSVVPSPVAPVEEAPVAPEAPVEAPAEVAVGSLDAVPGTPTVSVPTADVTETAPSDAPTETVEQESPVADTPAEEPAAETTGQEEVPAADPAPSEEQQIDVRTRSAVQEIGYTAWLKPSDSEENIKAEGAPVINLATGEPVEVVPTNAKVPFVAFQTVNGANYFKTQHMIDNNLDYGIDGLNLTMAEQPNPVIDGVKAAEKTLEEAANSEEYVQDALNNVGKIWRTILDFVERNHPNKEKK